MGYFCGLKKNLIFAPESAGVAQLVEHNLAKVRVAGSSPVSRSNKKLRKQLFYFYEFRRHFQMEEE